MDFVPWRSLPTALFCIALHLACPAAMAGASSAEIRPQPVGLQNAHFEDTTRRNWSDTGARPLETLIWYPAVAGTQEVD